MSTGSGGTESEVRSVASHAEPDQESFDRFFRSEYGRIVRVLYGMTRRWALAEELAQEAMLSAHLNWHRVRDLDRPDLWLRRVAVNRAISSRRRWTAEVAALLRLPVSSRTPPLTGSDDSFVWEHVRKLPRRQAAVIVLWAVEGRTLSEIGEVLGCSDETARTHLRRARERLQTSLRTEEDHDR